MGWNCRVVRRTELNAAGQAVSSLGIHEVYYRNDDVDDSTVSSREVGLAATPAAVHGESIEDIRASLQLMLVALNKPVLDYGAANAP